MELNSDKSKIIKFIKKHHVFTLASCINNLPYCANLFYALLEEEFCLVFVSDRETRHICEMLQNELVAGTIVLETKVVGKIQGLQFCGRMKELSDSLRAKAKRAYIRRFPYSAVMLDAEYWAVEFEYLKLTDNSLGFGKKIIWEKA
ncbi:MAG: hypothetical protein LBG92_12230 [Prevotellaceae bacterium]|jgi:uncharacterized protein YhbP (UPF0306 family)|nr:hypothetical protein [Prevotellaceae bacterium]